MRGASRCARTPAPAWRVQPQKAPTHPDLAAPAPRPLTALSLPLPSAGVPRPVRAPCRLTRALHPHVEV